MKLKVGMLIYDKVDNDIFQLTHAYPTAMGTNFVTIASTKAKEVGHMFFQFSYRWFEENITQGRLILISKQKYLFYVMARSLTYYKEI